MRFPHVGASQGTVAKRMLPRRLHAAVEPVDLALSSYQYAHSFVLEESSKLLVCAKELREVFDERFAAPRDTASPERYMWDPWAVTHRAEDWDAPKTGTDPIATEGGSPGGEALTLDDAVAKASQAAASTTTTKTTQRKKDPTGFGLQYSMLRTPAAAYFPEALFEKLCIELTEFGQQNLGCDAMTPPWLALYLDGHEMNWHTDAPHGPWAYVLSLTPTGYYAPAEGSAPGYFSGGETVMLRPGILDYWRGLDVGRGLEYDEILDVRPPAPFGHLLCFDGRVPHKVSKVQGGNRDPRRGRLVLTGWFSQPRTRAEGGLVADDGEGLRQDATAVVDAAVSSAITASQECDFGRVLGFLAIRLHIDTSGTVLSVNALVDTLVPDPSEYDPSAVDGSLPPADVDDAALTAAFDRATPELGLKILLRSALFEASFPEADEDTIVTLPLSFS